jgi:hypothetical protein
MAGSIPARATKTIERTMADFLIYHVCDAKMTNVWINHACVVRGDKVFNPSLGHFDNKEKLDDGLYVRCNECGRFAGFGPRPKE